MSEDFLVGGFPHLSMDVDADGLFLYLAVLTDPGALPLILRMKSDLTEDALEVYTPGTGSTINVKCGDLSQYVWAAGNFGAQDRVAAAEEGIYWYVRNFEPFDYWVGDAGPLKVGPHHDQIVSVFTNEDFTLHESYFVGNIIYWADIPHAPFSVGAFDRQALNFPEILVGVEDAVYWYVDTNQVEYSPNNGFMWGDVSTGLSGVAVTSVIYG